MFLSQHCDYIIVYFKLAKIYTENHVSSKQCIGKISFLQNILKCYLSSLEK